MLIVDCDDYVMNVRQLYRWKRPWPMLPWMLQSCVEIYDVALLMLHLDVVVRLNVLSWFLNHNRLGVVWNLCEYNDI